MDDFINGHVVGWKFFPQNWFGDELFPLIRVAILDLLSALTKIKKKKKWQIEIERVIF